jgi:hypothetical protein
VRDIKCSDPRIVVRKENTAIIPRNKTEIAVLTFNPAKGNA